MYGEIKLNLQKELKEIKEAGLYKKERIITSSQDAIIKVSTGEEVINFCANNYLGLSNNIDVVNAACLLYTSPSPRDGLLSRMPSSA